MIPAAVKALQDEVQRLMAQVDELHAKCERQETLLREALRWCPKKPLPPHGDDKLYQRWQLMSDLGDRIEAELGGRQNKGAGLGPPT
jgi:hypothetical protein